MSKDNTSCQTITISDEEREELVELYKTAQNTPHMRLGFDMPFWSTQAWNRVREKMKDLGDKYGYDPEKNMIDPNTGEVKIYHCSPTTKMGAE